MSYQDWMTALQAVILFLGLAATALTLFLTNKITSKINKSKNGGNETTIFCDIVAQNWR